MHYTFIYLQIERDTLGKLQCHPYPHEYVDTTKQCAHCAFFMGLQRKQGESIQEGQQFDIRGTVDDFRHSINMYLFWKPGMEIYVSHVRRRQLPSYVFPDGYKRPRPSRFMTQEADKHPHENVKGSGMVNGEECLKRKRDPDALDNKPSTPEKRQSISPQKPGSVSPEIIYKLSGVSPNIVASSLEGPKTIVGRNSMCQVSNGQDGMVSDALSSGTESTKVELRQVEVDKDSNEELLLRNRSTLDPNIEPRCASNSSVLTNASSDGSSLEDVGSNLVDINGLVEGNTGNSEESAHGNNISGSSQGDSCEADYEALSENGCVNKVSNAGFQEVTEVSDLSLYFPPNFIAVPVF